MSNGTFGEFDFLRRLCETPGVSGREERVRELILTETRDLWDETRIDNMGNLICLKRAAEPRKAKKGAAAAPPQRVMLACHMDEIGFYVRHIDERGFLRVQNAGGFDTRNLFARRVLVQGKRDVIGVLTPGGPPVHIATEEEKKRTPEIKDFYIDLFLPRKEVAKLIDIGDPVTLHQTTAALGDALTGKAMDDRVSLWAGINAVRKACGLGWLGAEPAKKPAAAVNRLKHDVYFVACVQEEVGLRGATTAAFGVEPDVGIAIDVTLACDTPGVPSDQAVTELGKGVAIKVMDSSSISHRGLFEEFVTVAEKRKIPHQREILPRGGTDAGAVQRARSGSRAITLSIPTRYIHTVTETIKKKDAIATVDLLAEWLMQ